MKSREPKIPYFGRLADAEVNKIKSGRKKKKINARDASAENHVDSWHATRIGKQKSLYSSGKITATPAIDVVKDVCIQINTPVKKAFMHRLVLSVQFFPEFFIYFIQLLINIEFVIAYLFIKFFWIS